MSVLRLDRSNVLPGSQNMMFNMLETGRFLSGQSARPSGAGED
jgi:hypothetical protein